MDNKNYYLATEYKNALNTFKLKPSNILQICERALQHGRYKFCYYVTDLYLGAKGLKDSQGQSIAKFVGKLEKKEASNNE